jgi:hypothetical protein
MRNKPDQHYSELFISKNRSLAITRSALKKRGFELAIELGKPTLCVYMNMDLDDPFPDLFSALINDVFENKYRLKVILNRKANDLLEEGKYSKCDLFILNMSRFIFPDITFYGDSKNHIEKALGMVTYLQENYQKPIIVISSWGKMLTEEIASNAGSDYFFEMPFIFKEFKEAIEKCCTEGILAKNL